MTEEIIIDGVDVAGCEFYFEDNGVIAPDGTPERANLCTSPERSCENSDSCYCNKDCYYKQLKRLEQENKKLKKDVQLFKCLDTFGESECHCACRCLGNEFCEDADKKINAYRSALEEIREILNLGICKNGVNGNCRPIRNTKKEDCYNAIYKVRDFIDEVLQ